MEVPEWQSVDDWVERLGWAGLAVQPPRSNDRTSAFYLAERMKCPCEGCPLRVGCETECTAFDGYVREVGLKGWTKMGRNNLPRGQ